MKPIDPNKLLIMDTNVGLGQPPTVPLHIYYKGKGCMDYVGPSTRLKMNNGTVVIDSNDEIPNLWHRFWYRILLGWKWEKLVED